MLNNAQIMDIIDDLNVYLQTNLMTRTRALMTLLEKIWTKKTRIDYVDDRARPHGNGME